MNDKEIVEIRVAIVGASGFLQLRSLTSGRGLPLEEITTRRLFRKLIKFLLRHHLITPEEAGNAAAADQRQ